LQKKETIKFEKFLWHLAEETLRGKRPRRSGAMDHGLYRLKVAGVERADPMTGELNFQK
jgi:hypothetical protein